MIGIAPLLLVVAFVGYLLGLRRARRIAGNGLLHSLPCYHGLYVALCSLLPVLIIYLVWQFFFHETIIFILHHTLSPEFAGFSGDQRLLIDQDIINVVAGDISSSQHRELVQRGAEVYRGLQQQGEYFLFGLILVLSLLGVVVGLGRVSPQLRSRNIVERVLVIFLALASAVAIVTTLGILLSVLFESLRFFREVPFTDFAFGSKWSPQTAMRVDQAGSSGAFGAVPLFLGTALIAGIAMAVAVPIGLLSAIYLSEYAGDMTRTYCKPMMEILAGIPTVVYGFFAALTVAPFIRDLGTSLGLQVASESALAAGLVMGVMIIPFVSSLSDDVIHAVPQTLRDGSLALGATRYETTCRVVLPAALPGIVGAILLALSRALGETMIVVMAAGLSAKLSWNPLDAVTTVTVQIVTLLTGDQEFDSAKTLAAFALGLLLFAFTLILNIVALYIVRKYKEQYE